jgi:hypothetical protein
VRHHVELPVTEDWRGVIESLWVVVIKDGAHRAYETLLRRVVRIEAQRGELKMTLALKLQQHHPSSQDVMDPSMVRVVFFMKD